MWRHKFKATVLLAGLISLSGILSLIFLSREKFISYEQKANHYYHQYLNDKMALLKQHAIDENAVCLKAKQDEILIELTHSTYQFYCEKSPFFLGKPPSKKIVIFGQITDHLRLNESIPIMESETLSELPPTTPSNPKIVILGQDINEKLTRDFYGVLITQHKLALKSGAKIYGILYSSQEDHKNSRYITYSREVVDYFDKQYSSWHFQANSRNILNAK
ncbi:DUF2572 family protein [Actinobacillus arthritidis]|uniref:DUF2572 family protein n=1 Tax=Actinobacillus arthritidis TaxID=157339 RepID=UPI0024423DC5|nr:DUF2572 family protein [Actinobacillus arthritidis]WGE88934.1 DUF2572 family protein [Actinobacillus arthritidis]